MFEMSVQQKQAFSDATNGVTALTFGHAVLFLIGLVATIWLFMIFLGTVGNKKKDRSIFESLKEFSWAIAIFIAVGVIIYYV